MTEEDQAAFYALYNAPSAKDFEVELGDNIKWRAQPPAREFASEQEETDAIDDLFATLIPDDYELPPRECCGAPDDAMKDISLPCSAGNCDVLYCRCGRSTESGFGSIGCPCQAENWGHWRVFERKMISVGKIALSTIKKRARRGRGA
jgi:hypothetical protein